MLHRLNSNRILAVALAAVVGLVGCSAAPATEVAAPEVTATPIPATSMPQASQPVATPETVDPAINPTPVSVPPTCARLNLNTLTEEQLTSTIPDFPNRMVREFFEYRPYVSIQQFRREIGKYVDAAQVAEWEKYVYVPVDPNQSDDETLMQIPGIDATVAAALAGGRPYASTQAFLDALSAHVTPEQYAGATCYLSQ